MEVESVFKYWTCLLSYLYGSISFKTGRPHFVTTNLGKPSHTMKVSNVMQPKEAYHQRRQLLRDLRPAVSGVSCMQRLDDIRGVKDG
jgi:hypothetical protein